MSKLSDKPPVGAFSPVPDRSAVILSARGTAADAGQLVSWLDNLVPADLSTLRPHGASFTGLLTPQGKIAFEFFVIAIGDGRLVLETAASAAAPLAKRLSLYRLRAPIEIDTAKDGTVQVAWAPSTGAGLPQSRPDTLCYLDPRAPARMIRSLHLGAAPTAAPAPVAPTAYDALRVAIGLAESPPDYTLGDAFPHEANYDRIGAVSFTKGCFIGQEVVARMQNKSAVRKRVVRVHAGDGKPLTVGADITAGQATIGRITTVSGADGLALIRLDRALEAEETATQVRAGDRAVAVDDQALTDFVRTVKGRASPDF